MLSGKHGLHRAGLILALALVSIGGAALPGSAATGSGLPQADPPAPQYAVDAGAGDVGTARTVPHWHGSFTDPSNGVTYGFNMVGADPSTHQDVTIPVDVVPMNFVFEANNNYALNGSDIIGRVLGSPIFQNADWLSASSVTGAIAADGTIPVLPGGELSRGNTGVQYGDALMRSEFNAIGTSYHVRLVPILHPAVTIDVPQTQGSVFQNSRGVVYGMQAGKWRAGGFNEIAGQDGIDPTHLAMFVSNNVLVGNNRACCALGVHFATQAVGRGNGDRNAQGNQPVQTGIYAAYLTPGTFSPAFDPELQDIAVFSHEVSEWLNDPFDNNFVNLWSSPDYTPFFGCGNVLETGDPTEDVLFAVPGNTYDTGPYADGSWHPQDEMFLPWFARQSPNTTSQATQTPTTNGGRYTFLGNLSPYPELRGPAPAC